MVTSVIVYSEWYLQMFAPPGQTFCTPLYVLPHVYCFRRREILYLPMYVQAELMSLTYVSNYVTSTATMDGHRSDPTWPKLTVSILCQAGLLLFDEHLAYFKPIIKPSQTRATS